MRRWVILIATHLAMLAMGFAGGVYTLPILTAPVPRTRRPCGPSQPRRSTQGVWPAISKAATCFTGEGEIRVSRDRIAHIGRLAPVPTTSSTSHHVSSTRRRPFS